MIQKMKRDHEKEIAKLLDENKRMHDKTEDLKMSIKRDSTTRRDSREDRNNEKHSNDERERDRRARTRCRYVDNAEGCKKARCQYFHPTAHCSRVCRPGGGARGLMMTALSKHTPVLADGMSSTRE